MAELGMDAGRNTAIDRGDATGAAPRRLVRLARVALGLLLAGAVYLIWVRGEAIMADLAGLAAWCF